MTLDRYIGIGRSLAIYYGVPLRAARMRRFYAPFVGDGDLCFDIGAHVGNRVRCWRSLGARVIALEPQPDFVRILHRFFDADDAVRIVPEAVGRSPGEATLFSSPRTPTVSTLSADWAGRVGATDAFRGVSWREGPTVPVTTLDALITRFGEPAFVKVDVEGLEPEVLAGLGRPLRALSFEYLPATRDLAIACVERLAELGDYGFNWSVGETLRLGADRWRDAGAIRDWIAALPDDARSGDVYARRLAGDRGGADGGD